MRCGGLVSTEGSMREVGSNLTIGDLVIQLLFIGFLVIVTTIFKFRISRRPTLIS
ncbi:hypothetical protein PDIG_57020 [Penicillium digitatum PHI26]|uniref:Uncharacterized protein n=1 Tax=Penicillium digitatum (strain PHI26 / CECT 20796) TaxID=1170229 RepID=K9G6J8_PEND2|nr:hypothetical protein PDIG_57020 [Penicillium digitatum PHI26]